jgi:CubicO group peptidase (beta-lactamase class C family)
MNKAQLQRLNDLFADEIAHNRITDAAIQVEHKGKVCFTNYYGKSNDKSIYKIYSMSKPITSTAFMMLFERGMVDLDDPVSKYIPSFGHMKVVVPDGYDTSKATGLETTKRGTLIMDSKVTMTVRNLLNMTSGMVYPGDWSKAEKEVIDAQTDLRDRVVKGEKLTNIDTCVRLSQCPLEFEPGSGWKYGTSADIIGGLVEVISGMKFGDFLKKEIFEPLGMADTWFSVPVEKLPRLIKPYTRKQPDGHLEPVSQGQLEWMGQVHPEQEVAFQSGGGYLYSTLEDYSRFARVLLNGGTAAGKHFLGRKTVEFMHTNQLTDEQRKMYWLNDQGYGYANLMRTLMNPEKTGNGSVGEFGWDGLAGTYFFIDQKEDLQVVYMQQICDGGDANLRRKFRNIIYSALD